MTYKMALLITVLLVNVSCSSTKKPNREPKVTTHIGSSGEKRFQVILYPDNNGSRQHKVSKQKGKKGGKPGRGNRVKREQPSNDQHMFHVMDKIQQAIEAHGFCSDGFFEIDRYTEAGVIYFNGQCNENSN